ncbi:hypothetical protein [Spirosoma liriopis]|nr:hypothetical protein [Spirosoma liriopis]
MHTLLLDGAAKLRTVPQNKTDRPTNRKKSITKPERTLLNRIYMPLAV